MAIPLSVQLGQIILAVQAQLMTVLGWPAERVLITDPPLLTFHPHGDAYLCLWPDLETADRPIFHGAGRLDTRMTARLHLTMRTRYAADDAPNWLLWLTDPTYGHLPIRHQVWNALVNFYPFDAQGNALSVATVTPVSASRPKVDPQEKEWGESVMQLDVIYELLLAQPPI